MKIQDLRSESIRCRSRIAATVSWENCDRPSYELYFETSDEFASDLSANPHAFLIASAIPAMQYGEKRVFIEGEICPELQDGLEIAMGWLRHWYGLNRDMPRIEAKPRCQVPGSQAAERAGLFFSGGIDSLASLRRNRLQFPLDHPWSIKDCLVVYGLELDEPEAFEHVLADLFPMTQDAGVSLIPVYTNLYLQYRDEDSENGWQFWWYKFMGAALAAVAHAFAGRWSVVSIAGDYDIPNQRPHGSHPILDPNYGSSDLRIRHDGIALTRFAKTKLVAGWHEGLQHLRVCNQFKLYRHGKLNCGKCEKCVRTMLALVALGVLDKTTAFPGHDVSEELIQTAITLQYSTFPLYGELIAPLAEKGRHDLVHAIEKKMAQYQSHAKRKFWNVLARYLDGKRVKQKLIGFKRWAWS